MFELIGDGVFTSLKELTAPLLFVFNNEKRIFWLYLVSAMVCVWWVKRHRFTTLLKKSFATKYWINRSTKVDFYWIAINQVFKVLVVTPLLIGQVALALMLYRFATEHFGQGDMFVWPKWLVMTLFTCVFFLFDDFTRFYSHYLYHKVPWLWRFHAIHHSAKVMTPLTLYRIHFVEYLLNSCRFVLVSGVTSGVFMYCFAGTIGFVEILGVNIFTLLFNLVGANLRHSHINIGFGRWEKIFISPAQHQIHHSSAKQHLDKNFGATLALWDKCFGAWLASKKEKVKGFGLYKQKAPQKISQQIWGLKR
ncbi:sterol desaturase family protein [Thalassotalea sp. PLHSN55]|uniref:sterol desaturase family protein n=1 Tax=Thalassotalea sp. PLHSN55 TaxID=3435888 RepID=UPI003F862A72